MHTPLFSIIVPVYKTEAFLRQCVDSILNQTYSDFQVVLVDDGSPDGCGAMCDGYAREDARIKVIHKKNGGLSDARNAGIDIARGEYIGFVDSDDWIEPDYLMSMVLASEKQPADFYLCGFRAYEIEDQRFDVWSNYKISFGKIFGLGADMREILPRFRKRAYRRAFFRNE